MSTSLSPKSSGANAQPTRQQLDDLDALLQKMLALPVRGSDAPGEPSAPPRPERPRPPRPVIPARPLDPPPPQVNYSTGLDDHDVKTVVGHEKDDTVRKPRETPRKPEVTETMPKIENRPIVKTAEEGSGAKEPPATESSDSWVPFKSSWEPSSLTWQPLKENCARCRPRFGSAPLRRRRKRKLQLRSPRLGSCPRLRGTEPLWYLGRCR